MPTFSAAALGRSLKPGISKSHEITSTKPLHLKPPISSNVREKDESNQPIERTLTCPQMSPSLYATPKEIPLPNSPSSYPPSPYIVNHKSHGPVHLKSFSEVDVPFHTKGNADVEAANSLRKSTSLPFPINESIADDHTNGFHAEGVPECPVWNCSPPHHGNFWNDKSASHISNGGSGRDNASNGLEWESYLLEPVRIKANKDLESEDFYNPGESVSFKSNSDVEDDGGGAESSHKLYSSGGEYYDARDELSSVSGSLCSVNNIEIELRGMRLSLLMEIEKRRQAEETLELMQVHWRKLREQLARADIFVPLDPTTTPYSMDIADELRCQLEVARFVSDSLGSDLAKAEVEMEIEMKSELEVKNFEITRLTDRLHYYENVNQEMSLRNQEDIEEARRDGQQRRRRQRWIWGSIATTITLGGAILAWSYLPAATSSSDVAPVDEAP